MSRIAQHQFLVTTSNISTKAVHSRTLILDRSRRGSIGHCPKKKIPSKLFGIIQPLDFVRRIVLNMRITTICRSLKLEAALPLAFLETDPVPESFIFNFCLHIGIIDSVQLLNDTKCDRPSPGLPL